MRILITGALGFLGVNLLRELASVKGVAIVATDLKMPSERILQFLEPVAGNVNLSQLDVTDRSLVGSFIRERRITHIIHGAALTPTYEPYLYPHVFVETQSVRASNNAKQLANCPYSALSWRKSLFASGFRPDFWREWPPQSGSTPGADSILHLRLPTEAADSLVSWPIWLIPWLTQRP